MGHLHAGDDSGGFAKAMGVLADIGNGCAIGPNSNASIVGFDARGEGSAAGSAIGGFLHHIGGIDLGFSAIVSMAVCGVVCNWQDDGEVLVGLGFGLAVGEEICRLDLVITPAIGYHQDDIAGGGGAAHGHGGYG